MVALTLIQILQVILNVVWWIIMIQFVLSLLVTFNVVNMQSNFVRSLYTGLDRLTEPMYRPIRNFLGRVLPNLQGIDLAPLVVLILLAIFRIILGNVALSIIASGGAV